MRIISLRSLLSCLFCCSLVGWLQLNTLCADDLFVNNESGDDRNTGQPLANSTYNAGPVRSIGRALQLANPGDRIFIEKTDTPYYESLSLEGWRLSGAGSAPFQIIADEGTILDGTKAVPVDEWQHVGGGVFRFQPQRMAFQQLYLDGKPAERVLANDRYTIPELQPGQWALVGGWMYFQVDEQQTPAQYDLRYCYHQTGITLYSLDHVVIRGLTVQGFQLDGINAHDTVTRCDIIGCKLRGNGRSGLSVGGASRVTVASTIAGANGAAQVRTEGYCRLAINSCRLLESPGTGPAIESDGGTILVDGKPQVAGRPVKIQRSQNASTRLKPR